MELKKVESSNIESVGFDASGELFVKYKGGTLYKYKNVPEKLVEDFMKAESKGKFMNSQIKNKYEYEKVAM